MAIVAVLASAAAATAATPATTEPTAEGLWEQSMNGRVGGWFFIFEQEGVYYGALVKMFPRPGEEPHPLCTACPGDQKNAPSLGLVMIKGMQRNGRVYQKGSILDPRDGSVYGATMEVTADGQKLKLRGYLGIPLFGSTQTWKRLPIESMPKSEVPENLAEHWPAAADKSPPPKPKAKTPRAAAKP